MPSLLPLPSLLPSSRNVPLALRVALAAVIAAPAAVAQTEFYSFTGTSPGGSLGRSVASAGDVNADGYDDVLAGAWLDSTAGQSAGLARVWSGKDGSVLHTFLGEGDGDFFGNSVDGAGDVDLDGHADVIVGAPWGAANRGYAKVYSGKTGAVLFHFVGDGVADEFGWAVAGIGDVNGDGHPDLAVGADHAKPGGVFEAGTTRCYSGKDGAVIWTAPGFGDSYWFGWSVDSTADVDLDGVPDVVSSSPGSSAGGSYSGQVRLLSGASGANLLTVIGDDTSGQLGWSAAGTGDVDADGRGDFIAGAPTDSAMEVSGGLARVWSGANGTVLFDFRGEGPWYMTGESVAGGGDVNGDGHADLVIGSPGDSSVFLTLGSVDIRSGQDGGLIARTSSGQPTDTFFGAAVASAGDVNADGFRDVVVGAPADDQAATDAGRVRVFSGACFSLVGYGAGDPGKGGFVPTLDTGGQLPKLGNPTFRFDVAQGVGGAPVALFVGAGKTSLSAPFGTLLVDVGQPHVRLNFVLGGVPGEPGQGASSLFLPIPNLPPLAGFTLYAQALVADTASSGGISHSSGLEFTFCQ